MIKRHLRPLGLALGFVLFAAAAWGQIPYGGIVPTTQGGTGAAYLRIAPLSQLVGNSLFALPDNIFDDTTDNSLNSRKLAYAPTGSAITDIVLALPGFGLNNPEADLQSVGGYTASLSVEYPIGATPVRVYFGGAASVNVPPGRVLIKSDPLPIAIPAGAQFAVKAFVTWTAGHFWMSTWNASLQTGEWTTSGTGVVDHTLDNTGLSTTTNVGGFSPIIYATLATPRPTFAMVGDSLGTMTADHPDTNVGFNAWGRAMRGAIPFVNISRSGDSMAFYLSRAEGRNLVLRDAVTHVMVNAGGNDLFGGVTPATIEANLQSIANAFIGRGVKVWAQTILPRTTSSDGWLTAVNQTLVSAPNEANRLIYNAWLRANWQAIGLQGILDMARVVDPSDTGKWSFDAGAVAGTGASGFATLSGGAVASVAPQTYNAGDNSYGSGYPNSTTVPCIVYNYPNTPGSGAAVHGTTNGSGQVTGYVVDAAGSGYTYPPMVAPATGAWTNDGLHPNPRSFDEFIKASGLAPELFQ